MADENKPAFYPRVGNIKAKNFRSAQPAPFIDDPRAMELPVPADLSVPTKSNLDMSRRIAEREAGLRQQAEADRSPLEKVAGALEAVRFMGSALTQSINSMPTRMVHGDEAAEKFMQARLYKPTQPTAYEYAQDIGDFLEKLETQYKLPPIATGEVLGFAPLIQAGVADAARKGTGAAVRGGMALEKAIDPMVTGALERGGLQRDLLLGLGQGTQSNVMKPSSKANWLSGNNVHVPEGDMWRFKTQPIAGETPAQRIPHHEELLKDPTLNQDQLDRVQYQLEQTKGEAALDKWADTALMNYFKGQLASPEDPVRLFIEKNYANIEAKFAKDQERAAKMAQRAEAEIDPRKKANIKRQADALMVQAKDDREIAMQNISHLPPDMLKDIVLDPKSYIKEERVMAGFPAEGMATVDPARKWEHQADEAIKVTRAGDIQAAMELQPKIDKALQDQYAVYQKVNEAFGNLLRDKGLDEDSIEVLVKSMPRSDKADSVGMLGDLLDADNKYLKLLDQDRSFPKFAAKDNPFVAKLDPETKMYSGYMGDLGFEHVMDVLRQDLAAERLRPEQLNKLSVEQAVKRTQEYNLDMARKMNAERASARANLPVHKEYPEGYKWVQLNQPGNFAAESQAMGHSVKGYEPSTRHPDWVEGSGNEGSPMYGHGGWDAIKSGRAKVYSLVDSRGQPHVTIETKAPDIRTNYDELQPLQMKADLEADAQNFQTFAERDKFADKRYQELKAELMAQKKPEGDYKITQIKGKGNAKPVADYIPYVQDFVKSGNWSTVGDISNAGLRDVHDWVNPDTRKAYEQYKLNVPRFATDEELDKLHNEYLRLAEPQNYKPPAEGLKRGGKVSISNNPDTMMLELGNQKMKNGVPAYGAGKAVIKMGLEALPRAVPKTKAEIEAIAQRIAPQMLGDFVRGEKGTQSVAGKTQKQFAKEKEMVHDIRPTGDERPLPKIVDIEKLKDQVMIGIPGDPTISGQTVHSIAGVPLESPSPQHGGPLYGLGRDDAFWASGLGAANRVQNLAREASQQYDKPVLGKYIMMGPESINYAQHYADANLSAIDPSKMTKGQIESFNNLVREGYPYVKNKERYQRVFPAFPGIENPSEAYLHFSIDPELRKHFNALMQMPTVTEKHGLPSGIDVRHAITEPDLRDLETGVTGKSIGRLRPEVTKLGLSEHPTYSHDIPGEFLGSSKYPIPYELSFPDTVKAIRENPKQAPHEFGSLKMVGPRQVIDQQMIDEIKQYEEAIKKLTGKKKGGTVHKAEGGAITGDDLIIEERPL